MFRLPHQQSLSDIATLINESAAPDAVVIFTGSAYVGAYVARDRITNVIPISVADDDEITRFFRVIQTSDCELSETVAALMPVYQRTIVDEQLQHSFKCDRRSIAFTVEAIGLRRNYIPFNRDKMADYVRCYGFVDGFNELWGRYLQQITMQTLGQEVF